MKTFQEFATETEGSLLTATEQDGSAERLAAVKQAVRIILDAGVLDQELSKIFREEASRRQPRRRSGA